MQAGLRTITGGRMAGVVLGAFIACAVPCGASDSYVARNGQTPAAPYGAWETAASNLQAAVDSVGSNGTVWVGAGTYTVPANAGTYESTTNVVDVRKAVTLRKSGAGDVVIDGQGLYRGMFLMPPSTGSKKIVVDGFMITNCFATNAAAVCIYRENTRTAVVENCVIKYNTATKMGGGIGIPKYADSDRSLTFVISNCVIEANQVTDGTGGGIADGVKGTTKRGTIVDCVIANNTSVGGGTTAAGGVYLSMGATTLRNCELSGNVAGVGEDAGRAGAVYHSGSGSLTMINCLVNNNRGDWGGGVYVTSKGLTRLLNCTIVSNGTYGVRFQEASNRMWATNSIFWYNGVGTVSTQVYANCSLDPSKSFTGTSVSQQNTLTAHPAFANPAADDFRPLSSSPCIDAGTNQVWMTDALDLDDYPRVDSGAVDVGCYEYTPMGPVIKLR